MRSPLSHEVGTKQQPVHYLSSFKYSVYPQDVGFHMCGSVRICTTPERLEEAKYQMQRHGWQKSPQRLITTEEVAQVHPLLNVDDVLGALYFPGGFRITQTLFP